MSNEIFQIIITVAVALALLSILVQGFVVLALYRAAREMGTRLSPILARAKAIVAVEKDSIRRLEILIDKTLVSVDILERFVPRAGALAVRVEAVAARAMRLQGPLSELQRNAVMAGTAAHLAALELRPHLASVGAETSALVRSAEVQVRGIIRVFRDASTHLGHLFGIVASKQKRRLNMAGDAAESRAAGKIHNVMLEFEGDRSSPAAGRMSPENRKAASAWDEAREVGARIRNQKSS